MHTLDANKEPLCAPQIFKFIFPMVLHILSPPITPIPSLPLHPWCWGHENTEVPQQICYLHCLQTMRRNIFPCALLPLFALSKAFGPASLPPHTSAHVSSYSVLLFPPIQTISWDSALTPFLCISKSYKVHLESEYFSHLLFYWCYPSHTHIHISSSSLTPKSYQLWCLIRPHVFGSIRICTVLQQPAHWSTLFCILLVPTVTGWKYWKSQNFCLLTAVFPVPGTLIMLSESLMKLKFLKMPQRTVIKRKNKSL